MLSMMEELQWVPVGKSKQYHRETISVVLLLQMEIKALAFLGFEISGFMASCGFCWCFNGFNICSQRFPIS